MNERSSAFPEATDPNGLKNDGPAKTAQKNSWRFGLPALAVVACCSCVASQQHDSALSVHRPPTTAPAPRGDFSDFIAPNTMPELCGSDIRAHTIGDRLYWIGEGMGLAETQKGLASWYGGYFHGRRTANGEIYDMYALSAAHKSLPLPSLALVTNLKNGKSVVVRVNDRGPFYGRRIIDLSYSAARELGMVKDGVTLVEVRAIGVPTQEESLLDYFSWSSGERLSRSERAE